MDSPTGSSRRSCIRMKLLLLLILATSAIFVLGTVTANFISDPRSMFPKVQRTKDVHLFLQFYMGTFKQMFRNKTQVVHHFNYYDDQVQAEECYIDGILDYGQLKMYFESYAATHTDPEIKLLYAAMNKEETILTAEFHVTTNTWLKMKDHFHIVIDAVNDEKVGWGVRQLNMAFDC